MPGSRGCAAECGRSSTDQAQPRISAALAAGGTLVSDDRAPAFTVLADPEGNKVCVCTSLGRD
jgi:4a-hydroxytetrahydrobiopterin dehydratase